MCKQKDRDVVWAALKVAINEQDRVRLKKVNLQGQLNSITLKNYRVTQRILDIETAGRAIAAGNKLDEILDNMGLDMFFRHKKNKKDV